MCGIHAAVNRPRFIAVDFIVPNASASGLGILEAPSLPCSKLPTGPPAWLPGNDSESCDLQAMAHTSGYSMHLIGGYVRVFTHTCVLQLDAPVRILNLYINSNRRKTGVNF